MQVNLMVNNFKFHITVLLTVMYLLISNNLFTQDQVYVFPETKNQIVKNIIAISDKEVIVGGASKAEGNESEYEKYLKIYDLETKEFSTYDFQTNSLPRQIENGLFEDVKIGLNGTLIMLFGNIYDNGQQFPNGSFSLVQHNLETGQESVLAHNSKVAYSIYAQKILVDNTDSNRFIITGSANQGQNFYFAEYEGDSLIYEGISKEIVNSVIDDFYKIGDSYYFSVWGSFGGKSTFYVGQRNEMGDFVMNELNPAYLPNGEASSSQNGDVRGYSNTSFNKVYQISDSILISPSEYSTSDVYIEKPFNRYDTISVGVYFFSPNLDSINYVDISRKYGYIQCGTPVMIRKPDEGYCFGASMNRGFFVSDGIGSGLIAKLDIAGEVVWEYEIKDEDADIAINTVTATSDGGCVFAGDYYREGISDGRDLLIVALDSLGTLTSISDESLAHLFDQQKIAVYPNPVQSQDKVNLSWSGIKKQNWEVKFYDKKGRLVHATDILQGVSESTIQLPELPSGNYIIRAEGSGKQVHTGTLVVE
jgi:hypothetical protein